MRRLKVLLPLLVLWTSLAQAGFEEGLAAYRAGDGDKAFQEFRAAAEAGEVRAFGKLGAMYLYGIGTETDYVQGWAWFDLAAEAGDKFAEGFRDAAARNLTPGQKQRAEGIAAELIARYVETSAETSE